MTAATRRRRRGPVAIMVGVLSICAVITWTVVLTGAGAAAGPADCPRPASGVAPGEVLDDDALAEVAPAAPAAVRITVLNAGGQRGQANLVAAQLVDLGFTEAAAPTNDPIFPAGDMQCRGQLRFGPAGEAAASTLALVLPCTQLVRDDRADDNVDVAVGTGFVDVNPARPVRDVLDQLTNPGTGSDGSDNAAAADAQAPPGPVALDPDDLAVARDVGC